MTNPTLIGDFRQASAALQAGDALAEARELSHLEVVEEERWRSQVFSDNDAYELELQNLLVAPPTTAVAKSSQMTTQKASRSGSSSPRKEENASHSCMPG